MMTDRLPVFVFGTLRRGHENHCYLEGRYERVLSGTLEGFARVASSHGYPLIDRDESESVEGELYFLSENSYEEAMIDLDHLEGLPPGELIGEWYQRTVVKVRTSEREYSAWAYVKPNLNR